MFSESVTYIVALLGTAIIIFILFYFLMTMTDLDCDYLNAQECCDKLNYWLLPKYITQCIIVGLFLLNGYAASVVLNMPMWFYLTYELTSVPRGNLGVFDYTEIHNRGQLKKHVQYVFYHLAYNFCLLFFYLCCFTLALSKGNPLVRDPPVVDRMDMDDKVDSF